MTNGALAHLKGSTLRGSQTDDEPLNPKQRRHQQDRAFLHDANSVEVVHGDKASVMGTHFHDPLCVKNLPGDDT